MSGPYKTAADYNREIQRNLNNMTILHNSMSQEKHGTMRGEVPHQQLPLLIHHMSQTIGVTAVPKKPKSGRIQSKKQGYYAIETMS